MSADKPKAGSGWNLLVDYGPLLAFFLAYRFIPHDNAIALIDAIMKSTGVFMVAIIVAVLVANGSWAM